MPAGTHSGFGFDMQIAPWTQLVPGLREKAYDVGERRFRILEFSEPFEEPDWCLKEHTGYVLEGEIVVNVNGDIVTFRQGDAINLPQGVRHRHESTTKTAVLFLIEPVTEAG